MFQADKRRVLLVDDDRDVLRGLGIRLRAAGYEVPTAEDGVSGLASALANPPDAIVLDLRMPRMDGMTMLRHLRKDVATRGIPVVVVSANAMERSRTRALDLGAQFFLEKPYEPNSLIGAIEAVINRPKITASIT
jgi:DNA-binding response OmpR family regulator